MDTGDLGVVVGYEDSPSGPERGSSEQGWPERGGSECGGPECGGPERGGPERGGPECDACEVLVGFDGSASSRAALAFGAERARRLGVPVRALIARREWDRGADTRELRVQVRGLAWDELNHWQRACPELRADVEVVDEPVRRALLRAARAAGLLVVGTRGLGEVRGLLHGSVSQAMVHHAPCPVAVVPEPYGGGRAVTLAPLATRVG